MRARRIQPTQDGDCCKPGAQWTDVYPLYTAKRPAFPRPWPRARPSGAKILIVTYNLPLNEIAQFTTSAQPSPARDDVVAEPMTAGCSGRPGAAEAKADQTPTCPRCNRSPKPALPTFAEAVDRWQADHGGQPDHFRLAIDGETLVGGIHRFRVRRPATLLIGMLLPESDLIPRPASISGSSPQLDFWPCSPLRGCAASRPLVFAAAGRTGGARPANRLTRT